MNQVTQHVDKCSSNVNVHFLLRLMGFKLRYNTSSTPIERWLPLNTASHGSIAWFTLCVSKWFLFAITREPVQLRTRFGHQINLRKILKEIGITINVKFPIPDRCFEFILNNFGTGYRCAWVIRSVSLRSNSKISPKPSCSCKNRTFSWKLRRSTENSASYPMSQFDVLDYKTKKSRSKILHVTIIIITFSHSTDFLFMIFLSILREKAYNFYTGTAFL